MCGICGFVSSSPGSADPALLQAMNDSLVHRGPDDAGTFLADDVANGASVALAMRRLSIIDLQTGHQPITNEDGTVWIVFNGEIYNHLELRTELEKHGHVFRTKSDTEAILHAYEEYGVSCVERLRGMFGFAIWDGPRRRLFIARDHVGIKPIYWARAGDRILFASEIKAILQDKGFRRAPNPDAIHHYLTFLYVPPPATMFAGIQELPPGHHLLWERGEVTVREYWAGPSSLLDGAEGPEVSVDEVWSVLRESVEAHMLADVPLGAFLSGGLDSTAIVALMAELSSRPVKTFSVGFEAAGLYDEREHARAIARHFRTEHFEFAIGESAVEHLPEIVRHLDQPLADASVIPNYLVAQVARQHVKVSLSGAGGDELFGGYRRYFGDQMARKWQRIPRPVRNGVLLPALRLIPATGDTRMGDASRLAQKFLEPLDLGPEQRYLAWNAFFTEEAKRSLYDPRSGDRPDSAGQMLPHFGRVSHRSFADRAMYVDLKSYLPGDPLYLSDRMTMANSLEARVPFVDLRVMDLAGRIPLSQKIRGQQTKWIIREALSGRVPQEISRRPKRGFGTPIDLWLKGSLSGLVDQALSPEVLRSRGYFRPEYVSWLREQQAIGKRDFSQHIWALFVLEMWHRAFIDADHSATTGLTFEQLGFRGAGQTRGTGFPPRSPRTGAHSGADPVGRSA